MTKINASNLTFEGSKNDLISSFKSNPLYKDYNFEASGINTLLSLFANHETKLSFYAKMLLDESNTESFKTHESLYAHSTNDRFLPKGYVSAKSDAILKVYVHKNDDKDGNAFISIPRGSIITSHNDSTDTRTFNVMETVNATNKYDSGEFVIYTTNQITIQEGKLLDWSFQVDDEVIDQEFIIRDDNIDISTLKVFIKEDEDSEKMIEYRLVDTIIDIDSKDNVFYVSINYDGHYKIYFGNNLIGNRPADKSIIFCEYLTCVGYSGNGARSYKFNSSVSNIDHVIQKIEVVDGSVSWGGSDPHNIEENRFLLKTHKKEQNRCITAEDFAQKISKFYGNIESINSWGGEDNIQKMYGKTCISIKPIYADKITDNAKEYIRNNITTPYGVVGSDIVFVDPEFINIEMNVNVTINSGKTNLPLTAIEADVEEECINWNKNIGTFNKSYSNIDLLSHIKQNFGYIKKINGTIRMSKFVEVIMNSNMYYDVIFGNKLDLNEPIYSDTMYYGIGEVNKPCYLKYVDGHLILLDSLTNERIGVEVYGKINVVGGQEVINFTLPKYVKTSKTPSKTNFGQLFWYVVPKDNDVDSYNNNIIRITKVTPNIVPEYKRG